MLAVMMLSGPDDEVGMCLTHDVFLRADMFLLSRVDNVTLLQDLHGVRLRLLVLQLHLNNKHAITST